MADMNSTPEDIISDEEIERVHGHASFGDISKRQVVNESVQKIAAGFGIGGTARAILIEHGLAASQPDIHKSPKLTAKGRLYRCVSNKVGLGDIVQVLSGPGKGSIGVIDDYTYEGRKFEKFFVDFSPSCLLPFSMKIGEDKLLPLNDSSRDTLDVLTSRRIALSDRISRADYDNAEDAQFDIVEYFLVENLHNRVYANLRESEGKEKS